MSHQTIVIREEDVTLRIDQVTVPSRITSKITLPVGGDPFTFCDENGGLLLTIDKDGNIISEKGFFELSGQAAPALSPAGKMRLYFDSATNKLLLSENGGAYADLMDGSGNVVGPASATDDALVRFDGATGKLIQNSNALLNDAGDLTLVGSQSLGKFLDVTGIAAPALSPAGEARLYFDSGTNKLRISENGAAFGDVVGGGGDVVGPASATDDALVRWDTATGKLVQDSNALLNDAGDLTLVGSQSLGKFLDVTGIAAPAVSPGGESRLYFDSTSNKLRISENGGAFVDVVVSGGGDVVGPGSATDEALVRFDGTTGKLIQNSLVTVNDVGNMDVAGDLKVTGVYTVPVRFGFESPNDWRFTKTGVIQFSIGAAGQLNSAINRGHVFAAAVSDSASAIAQNFDTAFSLTTEGAKLVSVKNATVEKFFIDKDGDTTLSGDINIDGDINHDGSNVGFYGTTPAAQSAAYTRDATIVEDRTLLASASATIINNNNVLAALIADLQATGLFG